jgi:type I restriction enzyme S subunit
MTSSKKRGFLPKLRFPEFREAGEWEEKRLGDVGSVRMCKRILKEQTSPRGDIPFYKIGTFGGVPDAYISREIFENFRNSYPFPKNGAVLISAAGTIGRTVRYNGELAYFQDSNIVWLDNSEKLITDNFLFYLYQLIDWSPSVGAIQRLYNENILGAQVKFPSIPEQQKIADCLASLDELITLEMQQLDTLKAHKKGLMQQLFPAEGETLPKLRFPEFREPWVETQLGNLCSSISSGRDQIDPDGTFDLYGSTSVIGKTKSPSFSGARILVARVGANAGMLTKAKGEFGVTDNTLVVSLNPSINMDFLFHYLGNININRLIFGSGQPLITGSILKNLPIPVPADSEQQKISACLSSLDEMITDQSCKFEAIKAHKKGLMQQLFPSIEEVEA